MKWLKNMFKKQTKSKVDLPRDWLENIPGAQSKPAAIKKPAKQAELRVGFDRVVNLSESPPEPKSNPARKKITTPVPAKKGKKTLDLAGKQDAFNRRSKSVIDMRKKP